MPKSAFCIPTVGKAVPASADRFHEIKYDAYRRRVERDGSSVRDNERRYGIGLEGLVSKRSDRPYRGGRSPHWIKVKNRSHLGS
jgi:ATP-dependent DNA ligase